MKYLAPKFIIFIFLSLFASDCFAYLLPEYKISSESWSVPAENTLASYSAERSKVASSFNVQKLTSWNKDKRIRLSPAEFRAARELKKLNDAITFWEYVVDLKQKLISMCDSDTDNEVISEADSMSKLVVETIYRLSNEYKISVSAHFQNLLVNLGAKKRGHCFHYATDIRNELRKREWKKFDTHWGCADSGELTEHNVVVVTAKNKPFTTGVIIDAWRHASKPYWQFVAKDTYKWKEEENIDYE